MIAYENLTVLSAVVNLTASKYAGAVEAFVIVEGPGIRYTNDGTTAPTTTEGILAQNQDAVHLRTLEQIQKFRCTLAVVGSPISASSIRVQYENNRDGFRAES